MKISSSGSMTNSARSKNQSKLCKLSSRACRIGDLSKTAIGNVSSSSVSLTRYHDPNISSGHDDGRKESATWGLSGCAILTMFNELDRAGHLKPDSKFQYLGLIMGMALKWSQDQEDYELEDIEWRNSVVAYAKKGGIDLADIPLDDVEKLMDGIEHVEFPAHVKADQWEFKKKVGQVIYLTLASCPATEEILTRFPSTRTSRQGTARRRGPVKSPRWVALITTSRGLAARRKLATTSTTKIRCRAIYQTVPFWRFVEDRLWITVFIHWPR